MGVAKGIIPFKDCYQARETSSENSIRIPKCRPKDFLDEVHRSSGDVINLRSMNELPRGASDLYNAQKQIPIC